MKAENKNAFTVKTAEKSFHADGFDIAVIISYDEKPVLMVKSVDISFGSGRSSKTENRELNNLFGTIESWFRGDIDLLPLNSLNIEMLSPFQRKVLCELRKRISRGKTVSYGELAKLAGFNGAARAVGTVMSKNPFPLFFPCHRVIRSDGAIGFFQGGPAGVRLKKALLRVEKVNIQY